ncbi:MAG: hypothetical protein EH225_08090 [Calditrichaeota bacterium]|nr:hypothetical protein [Calditrichota bacterium]RQW02759.1 MAG: hypothetical protein EH225_08090 [Calditrichota bacterium]
MNSEAKTVLKNYSQLVDRIKKLIIVINKQNGIKRELQKKVEELEQKLNSRVIENETLELKEELKKVKHENKILKEKETHIKTKIERLAVKLEQLHL